MTATLAAAAGFVVAAVVFGLIGYSIGRPSQPDPASIEGIAATLSEQQAEENRRMTEELAEVAEDVHAELMPVLAEMDQALPVEQPGQGRPATADTVDAWATTTTTATERLRGFAMGSTEFNGTHGALYGAVQQLDAAVATYREALSAPEPGQQRLAGLAATQRDSAVGLWGVGAEQLDQLSIEAELGHIHLFLPATGDPASIPEEFREPSGH